MLFGSGDVHHLIVTEERRFVGRFLREIREAISAPANLMGGRVAWIAAATRGRNPAPGLRSIGPHSPETILSDLRRRAHWTCAGGDVPKPGIGHANVSYDQFIKNGSFGDKELCKVAGLYVILWCAGHYRSFILKVASTRKIKPRTVCAVLSVRFLEAGVILQRTIAFNQTGFGVAVPGLLFVDQATVGSA
jgi:hypothetical protein